MNRTLWSTIAGDGSHYSLSEGHGMSALRDAFPSGHADSMNFVLFSTSGVHGSYFTIEDVENKVEGATFVTFLVIQPRRVSMLYGNCAPRNAKSFAFLKELRRTYALVCGEIGHL